MVVGTASFWVLARARRAVAIELTGALSAMLVGAWTILLLIEPSEGGEEVGIALVGWAAGVLQLPFSMPMALGLASVISGVAVGLSDANLLGGSVAETQILWLGIILVVALAGVVSAREAMIGVSSRIALAAVNRYCNQIGGEALSTLRLVAAGAQSLVESKTALLVTHAGFNELLVNGTLRSPPVDRAFARALVERLLEEGRDVGVFKTRLLGDQFVAPLHDWFGRRPKTFQYMRFLLVLEEQEQTAFVIIPSTVARLLSGRRRITECLISIRGMAEVSFAAARGRFLASDALLLSQRSAAERERELNELVHLVNNVAQDISVQCENIERIVAAINSASGGQDSRAEMQRELRDLEWSARYLSAGVSDATLLNELLRIRTFSRTEEVPVGGALQELRDYAEHYTRRKGRACSVEVVPAVPDSVRVISREFLDTCLRALLRHSLAPAGELVPAKIRLIVESSRVAFEFCGFTPVDPSDPQELPAPLVAVSRFAELSGGKMYLLPGEPPFKSRILLSLPKGVGEPRRAPTRGKWALFVDDNPQVTGYYGRIAEAFNLPFRSAASVTEAIALLDREGQPRFVLTDLQLGEESGLDLVRELRKRFGRELVVIVISGNVSEDVRLSVQEVGASKFLPKPVGRARLVGEMQGLLSN
jgi:CheY-like chemotaxis protein